MTEAPQPLTPTSEESLAVIAARLADVVDRLDQLVAGLAEALHHWQTATA
jgi:hypothetical protein